MNQPLRGIYFYPAVEPWEFGALGAIPPEPDAAVVRRTKLSGEAALLREGTMVVLWPPCCNRLVYPPPSSC